MTTKTIRKPKKQVEEKEDERVSIFVSPQCRDRLKIKAAKQKPSISMVKLIDDFSRS